MSSTPTPTLFTPIQVGSGAALQHRVVLAPLTRFRYVLINPSITLPSLILFEPVEDTIRTSPALKPSSTTPSARAHLGRSSSQRVHSSRQSRVDTDLYRVCIRLSSLLRGKRCVPSLPMPCTTLTSDCAIDHGRGTPKRIQDIRTALGVGTRSRRKTARERRSVVQSAFGVGHPAQGRGIGRPCTVDCRGDRGVCRCVCERCERRC